MSGWLSLVARRLGTRTMLTWALLLVALSDIALGLNSYLRGLDAILVLTIVVLGGLTGWIVAICRLPGWLASIVAVGLGIAIVFTRVGQLGNKLVALIQSLGIFLWQLAQWQPSHALPDPKPAQQIWSQLANDTIALTNRLHDWLFAFATGAPSFDPVAAALTWCFVLWTIAAWAAWALRRYERPLEALLPGIALLEILLAYVGGNPGFLFPVLIALLLLIVLTNAGVRERRWILGGIDFAEDIRFDLTLTGVLVSCLLILGAIVVPSISVSQIARSMEHWMTQPSGESNRLSDSLGLIPQPKPPTIFDAVRFPGLPQRHLVGAGPELSKQLAFTVTTDDADTTSSQHYYWRSATYERYTGYGWATEANEIVDYRAGDQAITQPIQHTRVVRQRVQVQNQVAGLLFATGTLVTTDHDFQIEWRSQADEDLFGANIQANTYQVESLVPTASELELRMAGSNHPAWIQTRYLSLPDDVPSRVLTLARDLTATAPTPYDRARAIETYLRGFPYTLDLPAPPLNRDVVDYFLFDLKRGYCDYYASAMVVLARAAGLPARLVVGYATGTYDSTNASYVVTEADAHSWVEIYFPDYGWIEFEPTGGRKPIDRLAQNIAPEKHTPGEISNPLANAQTTPINNGWLVLLSGIALMVLGIFAWIVVSARRLDRLAPESAIHFIYGQLCRYSHRLGLETRASDTPDEIARGLVERLTQIAMGKRDNDWQQSHNEIQWLMAAYVHMRYSTYRPDSHIKSQAVQTWKHLRGQLWRAWIVQKYRGLVKR